MSNVLVTGGAGFIGSHVCERMLKDGFRVVALDNFNSFYDPAVKRRNVAASLKHKHFQLVEGDIRDATLLEKLFSGEKFSSVIHLAAMAGVRPSIQDPVTYVDVNVVGTACLAEAARRHGVTKFVFGSSSSVYGGNQRVPFREDDELVGMLSPYAATKRMGERLLLNYWDVYKMNVSCLRFFTVYGPRQRPEMAIHKFTREILGGEPVNRFGDGSSQRDYTYIDDIVDGVARALRHAHGYEIYNLGRSETHSLQELLTELANLLGKKIKIKEYPNQPGDAFRTYSDVSKAGKKLGYAPRVPLRDGLRAFARWYLSEFGLSAGH